MIKSIVFFFIFIIVALFSAYNFNNSYISKSVENNILKTFAIEKLKNEIYYFPAKKFSHSEVVYQPLKRFDLIFVGHDVNSSAADFDILQNTSALVPGRYTHVLAYMGKDANGFAYAVEMNADANQTFSVDLNGLDIGGKLYLYCLGKDFSNTPCPDDDYYYGMKIYDYMWAKQLRSDLREQLLKYEDKLITTIKKDLIKGYPFQIPFDLTMKTYVNKKAVLIEDGRQNGADCVSYFVSLFEEIAQVCPKDIRISASGLTLYYLYDSLGQKAKLPAKYEPKQNTDIYLSKILGDMNYTLINNQPRVTICPDNKIVTGVPTPDLLFNSPDMIKVKEVSR